MLGGSEPALAETEQKQRAPQRPDDERIPLTLKRDMKRVCKVSETAINLHGIELSVANGFMIY